jgi:hypothetical protein
MREMSVAEQRYEAVRSVIADGETVHDIDVWVTERSCSASTCQLLRTSTRTTEGTVRPHHCLVAARAS